MKKCTLFIVGFVLFAMHPNAQEVVAGWTFPNSSAGADTGIVVNLGNEIYTIGGTSDIEFKNGFETKAAQASSWDNGTGTKAWVVTLNTEQYTNLKISSRQQSGGNDPGPKYFKLKYSLDAGESWIDIQDGDITVENGWEAGFVENLDLPFECENKTEILICWMMVSEEASGAGGNVLETGKSKIDDIFIRGEKISNIKDYKLSTVSIGPNPASDFITIHSESIMEEVLLIDFSGRTLVKIITNSLTSTINIEGVDKGLYIILVKNKGSLNSYCQKILIR